MLPRAPNNQNHVMVSPLDNCIPTYDAKTSFVLGIAQIVLGCVAIIFDVIIIIAFLLQDETWLLSLITLPTGVFCGIMFIVAGAFGIRAGKRKTRCLITAYMVLCIFAALLSPVLLYMSLIVFPNPGWGEFFYDSSDGNIYSTARYAGGLICTIALVLCGSVAFITFIIGSTLGCRFTCCQPKSQALLYNTPHETQADYDQPSYEQRI